MKINVTITHATNHKTEITYDSLANLYRGLSPDFFICSWAKMAEKGNKISAMVGLIF